MVDNVFPQFNDYDDPQNFAFHLGQGNLTDFVEYGLTITPDYTNDQFDIAEGKAYVSVAQDIGEASGETRHRLNFAVHLDARTAIAMTADSLNYVWVEGNPGTQDAPAITVTTTDSAPSEASIKIAVIDDAAQTVSPKNRGPSGDFIAPVKVTDDDGNNLLHVSENGNVSIGNGLTVTDILTADGDLVVNSTLDASSGYVVLPIGVDQFPT